MKALKTALIICFLSQAYFQTFVAEWQKGGHNNDESTECSSEDNQNNNQVDIHIWIKIVKKLKSKVA